eukprot:365444-Chlamydomonas_euryale.AAC.1
MSGAPAAAKARSVLRPEQQRSSARGGYWLGGGQVRLRGPYSTLTVRNQHRLGYRVRAELA